MTATCTVLHTVHTAACSCNQ